MIWRKHIICTADKEHLKMSIHFSIVLNSHLWTFYYSWVKYIISPIIIGPEMNSENQELFVLGTYVTKNNDLTFFFLMIWQLNLNGEKAGQIKIQNLKGFFFSFLLCINFLKGLIKNFIEWDKYEDIKGSLC